MRSRFRGRRALPEPLFSGSLLIAFDDDDAEGNGSLRFAIEGDLEGVGAAGFEAEGLEVEDHVAGDEVRAFREADIDVRLEGLHEVLAGGIDHADGHLVVPVSVDRLHWTREVAGVFTNFKQRVTHEAPVKSGEVLLFGDLTPWAKTNLEKLGATVTIVKPQ